MRANENCKKCLFRVCLFVKIAKANTNNGKVGRNTKKAVRYIGQLRKFAIQTRVIPISRLLLFGRRDITENFAAVFAAIVGFVRIDKDGRAAIIALNGKTDVSLFDVGIHNETIIIERKAGNIASGQRGSDAGARFILVTIEHRRQFRYRIQVIVLDGGYKIFDSFQRAVSDPQHRRTVETEYGSNDTDDQHGRDAVCRTEDNHHDTDRQTYRREHRQYKHRSDFF